MTALAAVPDRPDTTALSAEATEIVQHANSLVITDEASYLAACEFGKGVKALQKRIVEFFAPHKSRAKAVHTALCEDEKHQLEPTEKAERIVKDKVLAWRIAEAKREEDLRQKREAEALRLEEERRLQEALDAEEEGAWPEDVDQILATPVHAPIMAAPAPRPAAKVSGVSTQKRWTFDADHVDVAAVIRHIAGLPSDAALAHPELLNLLQINAPATRQMVTSMREHFNVPGIRAGQVEGVAFGSK